MDGVHVCKTHSDEAVACVVACWVGQVAAGSELGAQASSIMQQGRMVPTGLILDLLLSAMSKAGRGKFLVDGFPRQLDQLTQFEQRVSRTQ